MSTDVTSGLPRPRSTRHTIVSGLGDVTYTPDDVIWGQ